MKHYILIFSAVMMSFLSGCIQEANPDGSTILEEPEIESLLNGLPASMTAAGVSGFYGSTGFHVDFGIPSMHIMTDSMLEDLVLCGQGGYFQYNNYAMNLGQGPTGSYASYYWLVYYQGIRSANEIIARLDSETEDPQQRYWLGQALAYRAMCYLDLARLYEPKQNRYVPVDDSILGLTVPVVTEETTMEQAVRNPRAKRDVMYGFILSDLESAMESFEIAATGGYAASVTRPSLNAVYGLLARTYIEMGYWENNPEPKAFEKVIEYADKVIASFSPLTEDQWHDPSTGFNKASSNTSWVWGLTLDSSMTNNLFNFTAMMSVEANFSYAQYTVPGINALLYSKASDSDFRKYTWYVAGSGMPYRFAGTVEEGNENMAEAINYQSLKFRPAMGNCNDYSVGVAADHPLMRVEEMYFLKMEATLRHSGVAAAAQLLQDFLNTYRYKDGSYVCSAQTDEEFVEEMMIHKRLEFWGEGVLIYDYKRLDRGIMRNYRGTNNYGDYLLNTTGRSPQWNFCIPLSEMQTNLAITAELNNPDPTSFIGDPEVIL